MIGCACALPLSDMSLVTSSSQPVFFVALCPLPPMKARIGERHRPSSGWTCVAVHPRPPKKRKPSASGTRFCDWIDLLCGYSGGWFPTHWAPVVLGQLHTRRMPIELPTHLGWSRRRLRLILESSGRRQGQSSLLKTSKQRKC